MKVPWDVVLHIARFVPTLGDVASLSSLSSDVRDAFMTESATEEFFRSRIPNTPLVLDIFLVHSIERRFCLPANEIAKNFSGVVNMRDMFEYAIKFHSIAQGEAPAIRSLMRGSWFFRRVVRTRQLWGVLNRVARKANRFLLKSPDESLVGLEMITSARGVIELAKFFHPSVLLRPALQDERTRHLLFSLWRAEPEAERAIAFGTLLDW